MATNGWATLRLPFGDVIFRNGYSLLTNIINDVTFRRLKGSISDFAMFKLFIQEQGQMALNLLFERGYIVISYSSVGLYIMDEEEYTVKWRDNNLIIEPREQGRKIFVLISDIFAEKQVPYKVFLSPYIRYIDNVLNSSATLNERFGTLIIGSPKNLSQAPTEIVLPKSEKERLERELTEDYGSLNRQKQIMLLPREMSWQTINLAGFDNNTTQKINLAVCIIADSLQIPSNQIALIDTQNTKAFANGSELREGDFMKYATFERLLNQTFIKLANGLNLSVDYTIYNKPTRQ